MIIISFKLKFIFTKFLFYFIYFLIMIIKMNNSIFNNTVKFILKNFKNTFIINI